MTAASYFVHRKKGTIGALRRAVQLQTRICMPLK
ncbi:phage tail protein [Ralstonia pseudosolanacearum]